MNTESQYCVLSKKMRGCRRFNDASLLPPYIQEARWMRGAVIDTAVVPDPYCGMLHPFSPYSDDDPTYEDEEVMPEFLAGPMPILRDDLIESLREAGIDNLQLFNMAITDPDSGKVYTNYKAVNIVGCIKMADLGKSVYTQNGNGPLIDVDFDKLVIKDENGRGLLMFRLAESVNVILLHKKVRDQLLKKHFPFLLFYEPEQVAT